MIMITIMIMIMIMIKIMIMIMRGGLENPAREREKVQGRDTGPRR